MPPRPKSKSKSATPTPSQGLRYPYTIRRIYLCGHPEEYVQIERAYHTRPPRILHTLVPQPQVVAGRSWDEVEWGRNRGERSIPWPKEKERGLGSEEYRGLQDIYEAIGTGRDVRPHSAVSYQDRVARKMVEGPAREGHAKVAYVLQTAVHAALAEGLGHGNFEDTELERVQLVEEKHELLSPKATNPRSLVSTNDKRAQSPKEGTSSNMRGSPSSPSAPAPISPRSPQRATPRSPTTNPPQPRRPPAPRQPRTSPEHTHRPVRPKLPADSQQEIAHHRALALAALEGRVPNVPTPGERHSDTTPTSAPRVPIPRPNPATVPSYISRQRPFGPTSASGGTTLSYGDGPRRYDGVPIAAVMETLYPENRDGKGEGRKDGEGVGLERVLGVRDRGVRWGVQRVTVVVGGEGEMESRLGALGVGRAMDDGGMPGRLGGVGGGERLRVV
ncbi:hypothetical protein PSPO01_04684 [Paraphaeosphaeria sporulosa]